MGRIRNLGAKVRVKWEQHLRRCQLKNEFKGKLGEIGKKLKKVEKSSVYAYQMWEFFRFQSEYMLSERYRVMDFFIDKYICVYVCFCKH